MPRDRELGPHTIQSLLPEEFENVCGGQLTHPPSRQDPLTHCVHRTSELLLRTPCRQQPPLPSGHDTSHRIVVLAVANIMPAMPDHIAFDIIIHRPWQHCHHRHGSS
jgi:hypothetical protein